MIDHETIEDKLDTLQDQLDAIEAEIEAEDESDETEHTVEDVLDYLVENHPNVENYNNHCGCTFIKYDINDNAPGSGGLGAGRTDAEKHIESVMGYKIETTNIEPLISNFPRDLSIEVEIVDVEDDA